MMLCQFLPGEGLPPKHGTALLRGVSKDEATELEDASSGVAL
jgi:hypothetical protein